MQNFFHFPYDVPKSARIAALERKVENSAASFIDICNYLESAGGQESAGGVECCVDDSNNKMHCGTKTNLDKFLTSWNIDTSTKGLCDRRSQETPPTINKCHDDFGIPQK